jgi:hypothetical protein
MQKALGLSPGLSLAIDSRLVLRLIHANAHSDKTYESRAVVEQRATPWVHSKHIPAPLNQFPWRLVRCKLAGTCGMLAHGAAHERMAPDIYCL